MEFFYDFNSVDLKIILTQFFSQIDNNNTQTTQVIPLFEVSLPGDATLLWLYTRFAMRVAAKSSRVCWYCSLNARGLTSSLFPLKPLNY